MTKPDWKQAMLNEAAANAEADAAWAAEAEAYAKGVEGRKLLAFATFALLTKFAVPMLAALGLRLASPMVCAAGASACVPALAGVVLLVGVYAAFLGWQLGRRGMGLGWVLALMVVTGDGLRHVSEAMGWGFISLPDFALFMLALGLPLILAHKWAEARALELL